VNEPDFYASQLSLQRCEQCGLIAKPGEPGGISDDLQRFESALPLSGNLVGIFPLSSEACDLARILQQEVKDLLSPESVFVIFERAHPASDNNIRVRVEQKPD